MSGPPLITDGGTGTSLAGREDEASILAVHRTFHEAGADVIVAHTFLEPARVRSTNSGDLAAAERRIAARIALAAEAAGPEGFVAASLGPSGATLAEDMHAIFSRVAHAVSAADVVFLETMTSLAESREAFGALLLSFPGPILVSFAFDASGIGYGGATVDEVAAFAAEEYPSAIGFNCGVGSRPILAAGRALRERLPIYPFVLRPAACEPGQVGDSPEVFAAFAEEALGLGARVIGGCCGAGPAHVRALAQVVAKHRLMG